VSREALNENLFDGTSLLANFVVPPVGQWGLAAQRGVVEYPYDLRRTEELMRDAGYERGPDGIFVSPAQGRLTAEVKTSASPDNDKEVAVLASAWREAGFDFTQALVPAALALDLEIRASYPGMYLVSTPAGERTVVSFTADTIPMPENRWRGGNRSGWSTPEYTRLAEAFNSTLDVGQRKELLAQLARIFTEDVAALSFYFRPQAWAHATALVGPRTVPAETNVVWDMHTWELR
jgi:ABC-type transport system substrate-binding protein